MTELSYEAVVQMLRTAGCVFAEDEAALLLESARSPVELAAMVERRVAGEPLEVVVGWASFCGLRIEIDAGVFVPRLRTEFLVDEAARLVELVRLVLPSDEPVVVLDLCCGSGALGVALARDPRCRRRAVLGRHRPGGGRVRAPQRRARRRRSVFEGDLDEPLPDDLLGRVEVLLANVPYVPSRRDREHAARGA